MPHRRALLFTASLLVALVTLVSPVLSAQDAPLAPGGLEITPDGGITTVNAGSTGHQLAFWAANGLTTSGTWGLSCSATGSVTCVGKPIPFNATIAAGGAREVLVNFNATTAGSGRITLTASPGGETGYVDVNVTGQGPPIVALRNYNGSVQDRSLCLTSGAGEAAAAQCGDLLVTHAMPGFTTMNKDRSLTLIYNSAQAHPRPSVVAAVTVGGALAVPSTVYAELQIDAGAGFVQRASVTHAGAFWGDGSVAATRQIALAYDASNDPTRAYPFRLLVRSQYPSGPIDATVSGRLLVINRSKSEFGAGWSIAGMEQVARQPDDSLLWWSGNGSAKLYSRISTNPYRWVAPAAGFQDTIELDLSTNIFTRRLRHGITITYNEAGRHKTTTNRTGQVTTFAWNAGFDRLLNVTVPPAGQTGTTYTLGYAIPAGASSSYLDRITDPVGRVLDATIQGSGAVFRLTGVTDPDNFSTGFGYTSPVSAYLLASRTNRGAKVTRYEYTAAHRLKKITVPTGRSTTDPATAITELKHWNDQGFASPVDTVGLHTTILGPRYPGVPDTAAFWLDQWGAPVKTVIPTPAGLATTTLVRGNSTFPALVTRVTHPNGRITDQVYGARGHLVKIRDNIAPAAGDPPTRVTEYLYPPAGTHRDSPTEVLDSINGVARRSRYVYNTMGLTDTIFDPRNHRTSFMYKTDATYKGLLTRVTEHNVETWRDPAPDATDTSFAWRDLINRFDYDAKGNLRADTSTVGAATSYVRDSFGRVANVYDPLKTRTERAYDPMNRVTSVKKYLAPQTGPIAMPLQGCDPTQAVCTDDTQPDLDLPIYATTTYAYGAMSLESVSDPRGVTRAFEHDARGLVQRETDDYAKIRHAFYGPGGALDSSLSRTGKTVRYQYDAAGRRTSMTYPDVLDQVPGSTKDVPGDNVGYTYDVMGNLRTVINREGTITRDYYGNGLLKRKIMAFAVASLRDTISYVYDATGAVRTTTHGADRTEYFYTDTTGVLDSMVVQLGGGANLSRTLKFQWDSLGRRRRITYPTHPTNPMTVEFRYDAAGVLRRLVSKHPTSHPVGSTPDLFTFTYRNVAVNPIGRILKDSLTCSASNGLGNPCGDRNTVFIANAYNRQGALTRQLRKIGVSGSTTYKDSTRYDASGNIMYQRKEELGQTHVFTTNGPHNRLAHFARTELSGSVKRIVHNDEGARAREYRDPAVPSLPEDRFYYYDGMGRMTGTREWVGSPPLLSDREAACQYDGDGQMVGPCDPFSPKLAFDGDNTSGTMLGWHFFHGPGLDDPLLGYFRGTAGPRLFFWVTDGQGREFAVADSFATRQSTDDLNEIGAWRYAGGTRSGGSFDADRFSSSTAPKLSFFRNRAYDQETGRWTQEDPIGIAGGLNLYQFSGNNPVAYTDPFGLCPWCIGAVAGVATGFAIATLTGDDYSLKDAAVDAAIGAVGGGIVSKLGNLNGLRNAAGATDDVADVVKGSSSARRTLADHAKKLDDYRANPDALDNKGFLKNAPTSEIRERIIQKRIKHLEDEIRAIQKAIDEAN